MRKPITVKTSLDRTILQLAEQTDHVTQAAWGCDCAERVLRFFESEYPGDPRPRKAIKTTRQWIKTGVFKMAVIRSAALASHAAARAAPLYSAARSAARAAGQAVASAHAGRHAIAAAIYAATAIRDAHALASDVDKRVHRERMWQLRRLLELCRKKSGCFGYKYRPTSR